MSFFGFIANVITWEMLSFFSPPVSFSYMFKLTCKFFSPLIHDSHIHLFGSDSLLSSSAKQQPLNMAFCQLKGAGLSAVYLTNCVEMEWAYFRKRGVLSKSRKSLWCLHCLGLGLLNPAYITHWPLTFFVYYTVWPTTFISALVSALKSESVD